MQKIACVFSFQASSWVSCQKIVFNLLKSYQALDGFKLSKHNLSQDQTAAEVMGQAQDIFEANPDIILIMDHKPHPLFLFQLLLPKYKEGRKPRIVFHIFGDFSLHYHNWEKLGPIMKGFHVDFIAASDRQKALVDKFLLPPMTTRICPFPVDENEFSFELDSREAQRKSWGLKNQELAFVFTGRLSRQKRIHTVLKTFAGALKESGSQNAHLFLYGHCDHIGDPFMGKWENEGEYFRKIYRIFESLPEEIQSRIHFMGNVPNAELKQVYQAADYLVNLSVHNDEDYGMSVAEAQMSGLPAILTDWGGLASFDHQDCPQATYFIPVKIGLRNKVFSSATVQATFVKLIQQGQWQDRKKLAEAAKLRFGTNKSLSLLKEILGRPPVAFSAWSESFKKVSLASAVSPMPYINESKNINKLFREIYSAYVREH